MIRYRIDNLELRDNNTLEIVKWSSNSSDSSNKEYCYSIAIFHFDKDGYPELQFVGNRPTELNKSELEAFWVLVKEGYKYELVQDEFDDSATLKRYDK